jgi:hypothetical protein
MASAGRGVAAFDDDQFDLPGAFASFEDLEPAAAGQHLSASSL